MTAPPTYANHVAMHIAIDAAAALAKKGMGSYELAVLLVVARHINQETEMTWLSYDTIAEESLCGRRTAIRSVQRLVDGGVLTITGKRNGRTNQYRLVPDQCHIDTSATQAPVPIGHVTSATQTLHQCHIDTLPVPDRHSTSATQAPVVVKVVVNEVVKGSSNPTSVPESRSGERRSTVQTVTVDGQNATEKTGERKQVTPVQTPPVAEPKNPNPVQTPPGSKKYDRLLSDHYWEMLGSPRPHADALAVRWPDAFAKLLKDYSYADLLAAIDWAFLTDTFWPQHLYRRSGDPVEYFRSKADSIVASWRSYAQQQANTNRRQVDAVPAKSSISKMFKIE